MYPSCDVGGNGESAHPVRSCFAKNTLKVFCALAWPEYEINCFIWKETAVSSVGSEFEETRCPMLNCVSKELYLELLFGHTRQRGDRRFYDFVNEKERSVPLFTWGALISLEAFCWTSRYYAEHHPWSTPCLLPRPRLVPEPRSGPTTAPRPLFALWNSSGGHPLSRTHDRGRLKTWEPGSCCFAAAGWPPFLIVVWIAVVLHTHTLSHTHTHTHTHVQTHTVPCGRHKWHPDVSIALWDTRPWLFETHWGWF